MTSNAARASVFCTASSGWCDRPFGERTNSIAVRANGARTMASCPAPEGRRNALWCVSSRASQRKSVQSSSIGAARCSRVISKSNFSLRRCAACQAKSMSSATARSRVLSSAWRTSSVSFASPGITLPAPGETSMNPTVASKPAVAFARRSASSTTSDAATSASLRKGIGVVPACADWPLKVRRERV